ncbi:hypothetical protein KR067_011420 [Drosophila pandora]|nr:hypothetical protein KR067_011420 [Drosophila pandora]
MILKAVFLFLIPVSLAVELESSYPLLGLLEKCQSKNYQLQERLSEVQSQLYEVNLNSQKKDVELQSLKTQIAQQAALITQLNKESKPRDQKDQSQSNSTQVENLPDRCPSTQDTWRVYREIQFPGLEPFKVTCYSFKDIGSGWMEVYYKYNTSTELNQTYDQYINGFGNVKYEHFIGLEKLHILTSQKPHEVFIYNYIHGVYKIRCDNFVVGDRSEGNSLKQIDGCTGDTSHFNLTQGTKFSTFDRDQDGNPDQNWAQEMGYGFWFGSKRSMWDRTSAMFLFIRRKD